VLLTETLEVCKQHSKHIHRDISRTTADGMPADSPVIGDHVPFLVELIRAAPGHRFANLVVRTMLAPPAGILDLEVRTNGHGFVLRRIETDARPEV
jgi:hypothetical protein